MEWPVAVLGHLAADERAAGLAAAFGHAGHDVLHHGGHEPPDTDVVEEEQRVGALHGDVVDAHRHEVDADGVEAAGRLGHLQLGAHAVGGGHQHGLVVAGGHGDEAAEPADVDEHLGPEGGAHVPASRRTASSAASSALRRPCVCPR